MELELWEGQPYDRSIFFILVWTGLIVFQLIDESN